MQTKPYGTAVAQKVANYLENGGFIAYSHREYCGMGLIYDSKVKKYVYGSVQDGVNFYPENVFQNAKDFVEWLAAQSDESLSGKDTDEFTQNNQRITLERLTNLPPIDRQVRKYVGVSWEI